MVEDLWDDDQVCIDWEGEEWPEHLGDVTCVRCDAELT